MTPILQTRLPYDPTPRSLPGVQPMTLDDWLIRDDVFAAQMAERDRLICGRRGNVIAMDAEAADAADELLSMVLSLAYPDAGASATRPDGVRVDVDRGDPMATLGRLVQEDLLLLQKRGNEHVLTAAVLCFPASWTLSEKFLRPLTAIHDPVDSYDDAIAKRVQRLFDGVRPGQPLWRFNCLWYAQPDLYQPKPEAVHRQEPPRTKGHYLRSERQSILRLPTTQAVVFSVHTFVLSAANAVRSGYSPSG